MKPADDIEKMIQNWNDTTSAQMDERILTDVGRALEQSQMQAASAEPSLRRIIMTSPITKLAAAAVLIVAVLIGVYHFGGSAPAFAEVIQPLLTARTAAYELTVQSEGEPPETFHWMCKMESGTREVRPGSVIRILRHDQEIWLWRAGRKALVLKRINIPEDRQRQTKQTSWFHEITERIRQAQETEEESIKFLGKQDIDGVQAFVYRIGENSKMADMTVWADAATLLPIRIEHGIGRAGAVMNTEGTLTYKDIALDLELDESLFVVPEGYDVDTIELDSSEADEEALVQALRVWSENTADGKFPLELNMKATLELLQLIRAKMGLKGLRFKEGQPPEFAEPQFSAFLPIQHSIIRGIGFVSRLPSESDWHYAGAGVQFGDADTAIFWYRPEGSETYRVIYGNLRMRKVPPEDVPK